ncbi:MAG TPA: hypothetical protein VHB99_00595 [Pirellulales bacterium]|nr:hypothetical protein [Pirellulales bacterium]
MLRRFRFSLRSLMVVVTLLSIWTGYYLDSVRRQRQAVQSIGRLNGSITYDYELLEENGIEEAKWKRWVRSKLGDEYVARVDQIWFCGRDVGGGGYRCFFWPKSDICDDDLEMFRDLPAITELGLPDTRITNGGVRHLKRLTKLRFLSLTGTGITPEGVRDLRQALPNCRIDY